jgi:hypothetical protein
MIEYLPFSKSFLQPEDGVWETGHREDWDPETLRHGETCKNTRTHSPSTTLGVLTNTMLMVNFCRRRVEIHCVAFPDRQDNSLSGNTDSCLSVDYTVPLMPASGKGLHITPTGNHMDHSRMQAHTHTAHLCVCFEVCVCCLQLWYG